MFQRASAARNLRAGATLAIALTLGATAPASAADAPQLPASLIAAAQKAPLDFSVGGVDRGIVIAYIVDKDIGVPADALRKAEIKFPDSAVHTIAGVAYVSLLALAPAVSYKYDAADLSVDVRVVNPAALAASATEVNLNPNRLQTQPAT